MFSDLNEFGLRSTPHENIGARVTMSCRDRDEDLGINLVSSIQSLQILHTAVRCELTTDFIRTSRLSKNKKIKEYKILGLYATFGGRWGLIVKKGFFSVMRINVNVSIAFD